MKYVLLGFGLVAAFFALDQGQDLLVRWIAGAIAAGAAGAATWFARKKKGRAEMWERFSADTAIEEPEPKAKKTLVTAPWVFVIIAIGLILIILFVFDSDRYATLVWLVALVFTRIDYIAKHKGRKFFSFYSLFTVAFVTLMLLWIIIYLR